jgi:hypothetical protein
MENPRYYLNRSSRLFMDSSISRCAEILRRNFPAGNISAPAIKSVCYVAKYDVLYNRVKKNANSNTMVLWNYILNARMDSVIKSRSRVTHIYDLPAAQLAKIGQSNTLLITRDPYSRVLSAFLNKFSTERIRARHGEFELSPEGFRAFVRWVAEGGLTKNPHWDLQVKQILLPVEQYKKVIRFENYAEGMRDFLVEIGVPVEKLEIPGLQTRGTNHATKAGDKLNVFYDGETRQLVGNLYERDFGELGYDRSR